MKYFQLIIWLFVGLILIYLSFKPNEGIEIFSVSLVIYLFLFFKWLGRKLDDRKITRKMYTEKSRDSKEDFSEKVFEEIESKKSLTFVQFDADSIPENAVEARKKAIKKAIRIFDYASLLSIIAGCAYLLVDNLTSSFDSIIVFITGSYLIFATVIGHLVFRKGDLIAHSGHVTNIGKALIRIIPQVSIVSPSGRILALKFLLPFCLIEAFGNLTSDYFYGIWLLVALGLHIFLMVRFHSKTRNKDNHKLLILRVFGNNKAVHFTFNNLQNYWKHYGTVFTVVDPSFLKNKYQENNTNLIINIPLILVGLFLLSYTAKEDYKVDLMDNTYRIILLISAILIGIFYVRFRLNKIDTNFLRNRQDLHRRLERLDMWPRKWDQSFKQLPMMCYENTWFIAVIEFIKKSNVILMDLRGLSEEKIGCEAEINYLLDAVPSENIVFLANQSDISLIKNVINKNWKMLSQNSPNLHVDKPKIKIFVASEESLEDVQGLMDIMLDISNHSVDAGKV